MFDIIGAHAFLNCFPIAVLSAGDKVSNAAFLTYEEGKAREPLSKPNQSVELD